MSWKLFKDELPQDKQEIIVFDEGLEKELNRPFSKKFYNRFGRSIYCSWFCKKWKPNTNKLQL